MRTMIFMCFLFFMQASLYAQDQNTNSSVLMTSDIKNMLSRDITTAKVLSATGSILHFCGLALTVASIPLVKDNDNSSKYNAGLNMLKSGGLGMIAGPGLTAGSAYKIEQTLRKNNIPIKGKNAGWSLYGASWALQGLGIAGFLTRTRALIIIGGIGQELFFIATIANSSMFVLNNSLESPTTTKKNIHITPSITFQNGIGLGVSAMF